MIPLIRKITAVALGCILALSGVVSAAGGVAHCPSMTEDRSMVVDHCDGLLDFGLPMQGCFGDCNDVFCDLIKDPLPEAGTATTSSFQGGVPIFFGGVADLVADCEIRNLPPSPRYLLPTALLSSQPPLYVKHLKLII